MPRQSVKIVDAGRNVVATTFVECLTGSYSGPVNLDQMPGPLRLRFEEYEAIVENQIFSLLDQIEDQIDAIPFVAVFEDGCETSIKDLQIFPKGGTISFKASEPAAIEGR